MDAKYSHGINAFAAKVQAENPAPVFHSLRKGGLEPPRPKSLDPKSSASTNSATLASEASTAISNNALALFIIADAKSERIRLLYHDCQENTGSPAWSPSADSRKSLAVCHFECQEESHMYIKGCCCQPGIGFDCVVGQSPICPVRAKLSA